MRIIGTMLIRLLVENGFVDDEDRQEVKDGFKSSMEEAETSDNPFVQKINATIKHPLGMLVFVGVFSLFSSWVRKNTRNETQNELMEGFKSQIKAQVMEDILNE